jgi:hypothetical protein
MINQYGVFLIAVAFAASMATSVQAAESIVSPSPYMGGPVEMVKAPNGAITNKKLLDRVGDFNWLKPILGLYKPDFEKYKTWSAPKAERVK